MEIWLIFLGMIALGCAWSAYDDVKKKLLNSSYWEVGGFILAGVGCISLGVSALLG